MLEAGDSDQNMAKKETEVQLPRPTRVKNKTPASTQITSDQIIREARERHEAETRLPKQKIPDAAELGDYQLRKRKEFENLIRWNNKSVWVKYAKWEESQKDFARARSVWERALDVNDRDHTLWLKYADFEMRNKRINHARNVWDRATEHLPRVDQLWYKYIHMEETLGNVGGARQIFERWMKWMPDEQGWVSYINFELRYDEVERAREIFERQYGDSEGIEDAILRNRRLQYEDEVRKNPLNYDAWFDYIELEKGCGDRERIENLYERSILNLPLYEDKKYWQRYIYLWINYALYEELDVRDLDRTRAIYTLCLETIPQKKFSFSKIWVMAAQFEIRQLNIDRARKILGSAIGKAPKKKIFKKYIEIELQLGNIERCRKLYAKYLEWSSMNSHAWIEYAELERSLSETDRARALFELAVEQPALNMPDLLWKN